MSVQVACHVSNIRSAAMELLKNGFVVMPYDDSEARKLQRLFADFCVRKTKQELQDWTFDVEPRSDGTYEPEDGYLWRGEDKEKDIKHTLHWRPSLQTLLEEHDVSVCAKDQRLLAACAKVNNAHVLIASDIATAVGNILGDDKHQLSQELAEANVNPIATSRSVLRILHYPVSKTGDMAKVHVDRSAITLHAGDCGGDLFYVTPTGKKVNISPKQGEMLIFWGHKASLFAREHGHIFEALPHGARGAVGEERSAVVSFHHINRVVWDAPPVPSYCL